MKRLTRLKRPEDSPRIPVQEPGCGARGKLCRVGAPHSLQRCSKQGAVHGLRVQRCRKQSPPYQGAGNRGRGLLHTEPVEGGIVGRSELEADASINHRNGFRSHGEGGEGVQVG